MRYVDCVGTPQERLERNLKRMPNGCLEWQGGRNRAGYGMIRVAGKGIKVHRLAWQLANGPIPDGQLIRHYICDNPPCCDVAHLRPGTKVDNAADRFNHGRWAGGMGRHNAAKTHCPDNHAYDEVNTYVSPKGQRFCRECGRVATARYLKEKKASQFS